MVLLVPDLVTFHFSAHHTVAFSPVQITLGVNSFLLKTDWPLLLHHLFLWHLWLSYSLSVLPLRSMGILLLTSGWVRSETCWAKPWTHNSLVWNFLLAGIAIREDLWWFKKLPHSETPWPSSIYHETIIYIKCWALCLQSSDTEFLMCLNFSLYFCALLDWAQRNQTMCSWISAAYLGLGTRQLLCN